MASAPTITDHEDAEIERANTSERTPVVFIHGLWLLPSSWDRLAAVFEEANAVSEEEAKELYETYAVPASGTPLFQAATANLTPWTEAKVDSRNPARGPLLIVSGELDHSVPWRSPTRRTSGRRGTRASRRSWRCPGRGHALTIDSGWREVADTALAFVQRFT